MEQFRLLLAIGLSFLVLFVWSMFFVDQQPATQNQQPVQTGNSVTETPVAEKAPNITNSASSKAEVEEFKSAQFQEKPTRTITVTTHFTRLLCLQREPLSAVIFSNNTGKLSTPILPTNN